MNYCVLIKFSKGMISVWYKLKSEKFAPFEWNNSNNVPLFFYINENNFEFGSLAREKFYSNDPDAYGDYFEITKDPSKDFIIQGNKKPVKHLLYLGIEQLLSNFLNRVLYKQDSIKLYKDQFPLRFLFERDIEVNEKLLVENLFSDAGYNNIESISFNKYFFLMLEKKHILPQKSPVLLLNSIENTLYIDLYNNLEDPHQVTGSSKLEKEGSDPRVQVLADKILNYILVQNSFLNIDQAKDKEINALIPLAEKLLETNLPIHTGTTRLLTCTGGPYYFKVRPSEVNEAMQFNYNDSNITSAIDEVLKISRFNASNTYIVLGSKKINTTYFASRLLSKYPHIVRLESADISHVLSSIFDEIEGLAYRSSIPNPTLKLSPKAQPIRIEAPNVPPAPVGAKPPPIPSIKGDRGSNPPLILNKPALPPVLTVKSNNKANVIKQPPLPPKKIIP